MASPMTYGQALSLASVPVPGHLQASAEVPVLLGVQAQGDLLIVPLHMAYDEGHRVPTWPAGNPVGAAGVQVVRGESTGNTHWLHAGFDSPGVAFHSAGAGQVVGVLTVPAGQTAMLIHTDEHGANGIGPGTYEIRRKREQAHEPRFVED
jgi:hypothetical protein